MKSQMRAFMNSSPISAKATSPTEPMTRGEYSSNEEQGLQGGEIPDGEDLCRCLIALAAARVVLCRQPWGPREPARAPLGRLATFLAVLQSVEQRPDGHQPSCRPQALRQSRDDDRVPTMVSEHIVPSQRVLEHVPADRQHFLRSRLHVRIGVGRSGLPCLRPA